MIKKRLSEKMTIKEISTRLDWIDHKLDQQRSITDDLMAKFSKRLDYVNHRLDQQKSIIDDLVTEFEAYEEMYAKYIHRRSYIHKIVDRLFCKLTRRKYTPSEYAVRNVAKKFIKMFNNQ